MLTITRALAAKLKTVFRQALGPSKKNPMPPIEFAGGSEGLRVRCRTVTAAAEFHLDGEQSRERFLVPWELLCDVEGRKEHPIHIARDGDCVVATWTDGVIPRTVRYDTPEVHLEDPWPTVVGPVIENRPELLRALTDAAATTGSSSPRFALDHIQLQGKAGKIVATDARQALMLGGFVFPWDGDILVRPSRVFSNKHLRNDKSVFVSASEDWFRLNTGPWTFLWKVNKSARYPTMEDHVGNPDRATTTLEVSESDREFLKDNLSRLPSDSPEFPVIVDLNGSVAVRAKPSDQVRGTELILRNSTRNGRATRFVTDRHYLARAVDLGFSRFHAFNSKPSFLATDGNRQHFWVTTPAAPADKNADTIRIESPLETTHASPQQSTQKETSITMHENSTTKTIRTQAQQETPQAADTPADVLEQAGTLRGALRDALAATSDLIRSLKQDKKRRKAVENTLASLRQLDRSGA